MEKSDQKLSHFGQTLSEVAASMNVCVSQLCADVHISSRTYSLV